jgi:iron complex outermembrane receptor protein
MDLRFAYRPRKHVELAVVGQNLLQEFHQEFSNVLANNDTDIPRGVYGTVTWRR